MYSPGVHYDIQRDGHFCKRWLFGVCAIVETENAGANILYIIVNFHAPIFE